MTLRSYMKQHSRRHGQFERVDNLQRNDCFFKVPPIIIDGNTIVLIGVPYDYGKNELSVGITNLFRINGVTFELVR